VFDRERVLIAILDQAGQPLGRTRLVKLAFLVEAETPVPHRISFYDFIPYRYGPFSFLLYHELGRLMGAGLVLDQAGRLSLSSDGRGQSWRGEASEANPSCRDVMHVMRRHGSADLRSLLGYVYQHYSWYAAKSELMDHCGRSPSSQPPRAIYTVGYQGCSVDSFLRRLLTRGIDTIIDVRANPVSRKYGFSKKALSRISNAVGIGYQHAPSLGISASRRRLAKDNASRRELLDSYEHEILPRHRRDMLNLVPVVRRGSCALVCAEQQPEDCHRTRLAQALSQETGLPVFSL